MGLDDHLQGLSNTAAVSELPGMAFRCRNDPDWTLVYASEAVSQITGYSAAELSQGSMNWMSLLHPEDVAPLRGIVAQAVQRGQPFQVEYRIRHRDGSQRWLCEQGRGVFDAAGNCVALEGFINDISEHKRIQSELAAAKQLLDAHMENSPLAVIEFDAQLRVIRWSNEAERLFGWRAEEVLQRTIDELHWVYEDDQAGVAQLSADMLANTCPRNKHVNRNYRKDGCVIYCEWYNSAIRDSRGELASILSQVLDISERKRAEQVLGAHEVLLSRVQEIARLGFWELDLVHDQLTLSSEACCILDVQPREVCTTYADFLLHIHPDDRSRVDQAYTASLAELAEVFEFEHRVVHGASSEIRHVREKCEHIFGADGQITRSVCIAHDITLQSRTMEALRASEALLSTLMDHVPAPIQGYDTDGIVTYWNRASEQVYGYSAEEAVGRPLGELIIPPAIQPLLEQALVASKALTASGEFMPASEVDLQRKDGSAVPIYSTHTAVCRPGHPPMLFCLDMDLSERKQVEQELARSRRLVEQRAAELDALLQAVPAAVWIAHDAECSRVTGNRTAYEWIHMQEGAEFSLTENHGEWPPCMKVSQDGRELRVDELPLFQAAAGVEVRDCEEDIVLQDGSKRTAFGHATPLWNEQGKPRGAIAAFVDITERKHAEEALKEADRRKNEFLALLAHELRNPLAPIRNAVAILRLKGSSDPVLQEARNMIDRQLQNLVRLVDDLLDVSRITHGKLQLRRTRVALATVLEQALETVHPQLEQSSLTLTVSLPGAAISLDADPARLAQVFLNLLNNAIKYSEPGDHIDLSAELDGKAVVVQVRDNGIGILPEHLPRLFEMFAQLPATPDRTQGGLGLGLALARSLVEMHGGHIEARSEGPGRGSEFIVHLPVLAATTENPPVAGARDELQPGTCRVLVADDKPDALNSLVMLLRLSGHEVAIAHDGQEAVEVAARFRPDVALLDIGMPRLNGYDACRHIRQQPWGKDMIIIALTGWGQEEDLRNSKAAGFSSHLVKPVDPTALLQLLAEPRTLLA